MLEFHAMTLPNESEKARRRRNRRTHSRATTAVFILGFILILGQLCVCSANLAPSRWSPARKARFYYKGSSSSTFQADSRTNYVFVGRDDHHEKNHDKLYDEDEKRLVHTGPNPLHN